MISLILPFWMRQRAADRALASLALCYAGTDLEVIVVDDGSEVPFVTPECGLEIRVVTLPRKDGPKSPVSCWNAGVREARGDVVALSCIEVIHEEPILEALADNVRLMGPKGYALAAAWCPEDERWHCHSTVKHPMAPEGTGLGFCAAIHKSFYEELGGFDEDFRDGAGYEDIDWINRLIKAGAKWQIRDDLKVIHPKTGATTAWTAEQFSRNFDLYCRKWPGYPGTRRIHFACVNAQNYLGMGAQYVNTLFDMVRRNMPAGSVMQFWCLTDDPSGLHPQISVIPLPPEVRGWYGKLYLFKRGLFPAGERVIFLDLDTLIIGSLAGIIDYDSELAMLSDFWQPSRGAPGIMLWEADQSCDIYDEWVAQGRPENPMGDLGFINNLDQGRYCKRMPRLQDLFPGKFVSYKTHCKPYPPAGAAVVCFHGEPRPHNCGEEWVGLVWRVGGGKAAELESEINTRRSRIWENVRAADGYPRLATMPAMAGEILLVGGGPSLESSLGEIREKAGAGAIVCAMNGTADYLTENGIRPHWHVMVDARPENARFLKSRVAMRYFLSATCDPASFAAVEGCDVTVFHPHIPGIEEHLTGTAELIGGGSTVGLLSMTISFTQGLRVMHLYGYDSSYAESHHAYSQPENDGERTVDAVVGGRKFRAAAWMVQQVQEFQALAGALACRDCEIHTHGYGLLPHVAWCMTQQMKEAA